MRSLLKKETRERLLDFYWSARRKIRDIWYVVGPRGIRDGVASLWYWFPVIWQDKDWDYHFTLHVLHHSLKRLENGLLYNWDNTPFRKARELKVAIVLLDRIIDGDYSKWCRRLDEPEETFLGPNDIDFRDWRKIEESDWTYLWPLLQKNMQYWWD